MFLALVAEALDVFGAFHEGSDVAALDELANLLDDVGIGEGGDVASVHVIGDGGEDAAHDLTGAGLGHVWNNVDGLGAGDFADHGFDGGDDFVLDGFGGRNAGLQRDVDDRDAAFDFVDGRDDGGFGDFGDCEAGGFDFLGAEAVAGDVDDVIDAPEDAIVTVGGEHGAVRRIVRPVAPVLALRILVVLFVVLRDEALGVAPNGLHDARPGIADANVAGVSRACFHFLSFLVPNDRINAEDRRTGAARLHEVERRLGAAEESPGFRLPPGVDDDCFALANDFVIPLPDFRLDRFANGGHVLEVVVVIFRSVAAGFAKHADGRGRSVENVDVEAFGDAPGTAGVGELRHAFVEDAGRGESHRAVNDIRVPGNPADVSHAPVDVLGMNVLVILGGACNVGEVASGAVLAALGFAGGAAGVHQEERSFGVLRDGLDDLAAIVFQDFVDEDVAAHDHGCFRSVFSGIAFPHEDLVNLLALFRRSSHGDVSAGFVIHPLAVAVISVGVDEDAAAGIGGAQAAGFAAEAAEDDGVHDAESRAGQHGDGQLRNHGHVDGDAIAGFQSGEIAKNGGNFVYALVEFLVGDDRSGFDFRLRDEDQRGLVLVFGEVAVDAVVAGVEFAADEPFPEGRVARVEGLAPGFVPMQEGSVMVEALRKMLFVEFFDEGGIGEIGLNDEFLGRSKVFFFFPVNGNLRFGELLLALRCFPFLTCFGHGGNSPSKIDYGCDATTRAVCSGKLISSLE